MVQDDLVDRHEGVISGKHTQPRTETHTTKQPSSESVSVANVAKWLVPSVTAFFVVVGYVVQSAQQNLLGLYYADRESSTLIISAGAFFRDLIVIPAEMGLGLLERRPVSLGGHGPEIVVATVLVVVALSLPRLRSYVRHVPAWLPEYPKQARVWVFAGMLGLLVVGKFALLDRPLFNVSSIVLGNWERPPLASDFQQSILERDSQGHLDSQTSSGERSRAERIVASIVCSRISQEAASRDPELQVHELCTRGEEFYKLDLKGQFIAQLWATSLILIVALALLRSPARTRFQVALAVLALTYSLIVVYAYGKLQRSTYFDFGMVRVAEPSRGPHGSEQQPALILARNAAGTTLLVETEGPCSIAVEPGVSTEDLEDSAESPRYTHVTLMVLSPSQVLAVERIYRQDVIAWAVRSERKCPSPPAPL